MGHSGCKSLESEMNEVEHTKVITLLSTLNAFLQISILDIAFRYDDSNGRLVENNLMWNIEKGKK